MNQAIVRLVPRARSIDEAKAAFLRADFRTCLSALHQHDGLDAAVLRARALLRLDRPAESVTFLETLPVVGESSHLTRGEALVLRAAAQTRLGRIDEARDDISMAFVHVVSACDVALEAEHEYYRALLEWTLGNYRAAMDAVEAVCALRATGDVWSPIHEGSYIASLSATQARAMELRGFEAARIGNAPEQLRLLRRALDRYDQGGCADAFIAASLLRNLAFAARELDSRTDAARVAQTLASTTWTEDLQAHRYDIVRALGWCDALAGNHIGALRRFRQACDLAKTPGLRLLATVDRAYLAVELAQDLFAAEEIEAAREFCNGVDWTVVRGEESSGLLILAQLIARRDPREARALLERYRRARAHASVLTFARLDPRVRGMELHTQGLIEVALDPASARGRRLLADAFELFDHVGSQWRAAVVASDLADLRGAAFYEEYADREAAKRPLSWIARRRRARTA